MTAPIDWPEDMDQCLPAPRPCLDCGEPTTGSIRFRPVARTWRARLLRILRPPRWQRLCVGCADRMIRLRFVQR